MTTAADLDVRTYGQEDLPAIRQTLLGVHADAYADVMDDEFTQRFPWFVTHWGGKAGFSCAIGYDGDEPVGFAYGAPAPPGREWWREHVVPPPRRDRTFAVSELMVRPRWRGTGAASRLHDRLLADRAEHLAVLLVDTGIPKVRALYEAWGYHKVGERRPFPDSPVFSVMLTGLPRGRRP